MTQFKHYAKAKLRWIWRYGIFLTVFSLSFIALSPSATIQFADKWDEISFVTTPQHFDFISWEAQAILAKAEQTLFGQHAFMNESQRSDYVRDYMADLARLQSLEAQITTIYIDPTITNADEASANLRTERDTLRENIQARQSTTEAIIEGQVAAILVGEGFGIGGQLLPPMAMRFTGMPNLLVTSPRDSISLENSIVINPITIDERFELEDSIANDFDASALVVPLGGIALYPAMIAEISDLSYVIETFAHEWLHHYLYFYPLGLSYFTGDAGEARIINETTADLFGKEIAALVIARYYPELSVPQLPTYDDTNVIIQTDPNAFNFAAEMNETRVTVDDYLSNGDVEGAETYMEARRIFFFENGFSLRRINQAFFAFYGGYQAGGGVAGASGADPIGPTILSIRELTASPQEFVQLMRDITNREQLFALEAQLRARD